MKKIIFILMVLTIIGKNSICQELPVAVDNWSYIINGNGVKIEDVKIVSENLIYMVTREYTTHLYHFLKRSTDRGNSWKKLDSIQVYSYPDETKKGASICFINENTIIISNTRGIYKYTTNGGSILKLEFSDNGTIYSNLTSKVIFTGQLNNGSNILYALLTFQRNNNVCIVQKGKVYKSIDLGETWIQAYNVQPENDFDCINYESIDYKKDDGNKVIVCGYLENKPWGNSIYNFAPIVLYSEYGFAVNTPVYNVDLNNAGTISDVYVKSNGEVIYLFRSRSIVNNPIQYTKVFKHIWGTWGNPSQLFSIRSAPFKAAIQHGMSFCGDNDGYIIINYLGYINNEYVTGVYKTTDGGVSWPLSNQQLYPTPTSYTSNIKMPLSSFSSSNADLAYLSPQSNELFIKMMDGIYIKAIIDNFYNPLNNVNINITAPNQGDFLTSQTARRVAPFGTLKIYENQNNNDRIFYKWDDNSSNSINNKHTVSLNPSDQYYKNITAIYKGKDNADNQVAINNPNQVKALRDSTGTIHKIYESLGGIFYSRSTDNGETFQREEIVNAGNLWNQTYPDDKSSASENRNPSLSEIRNIDGGHALSVLNAQNSITACWEHYVPPTNSNSSKIEIKVASRQTNGGNDWYKYGTSDAITNLHGVIKSFPASSEFTSKPVIFASANNTYNYSNLYNQFLLVPHLEPSSNGGKKIVVTAKYKNYGIYPSNGYTNDFIIADGNSDGLITDYSVAAEPTFNNNIYNGYELHFAYLRGNLIKYQRVLITLASANGTDFQLLKQVLSSEELISYADNQLVDRSAPDISMKNGYPVICYSGHWTDNRYVYYEEDNDNPQLLSYIHYPIWIKYKSPTSSSWVSFGYDNYTQATNPNIEGAIRDNAFLLSFKKFNSYYQFVRFDVPENYNCNPGSYNQTDAKLVKGSYINKNGKLGSNNTPLLLTLSNPNQGIYSVGKQPFEIIHSSPAYQTDGFSNLVGTIEKNNTSYTLSVGPIIVSNTTSNNNSTDVGFPDATPPQTVHNPVEFNETMVSAVFTLSNNDTLILGSYGSFLATSVIAFNPIKYHVNLINYTSGSIHRELFRDTISIEDSTAISYLRGFVINNIEKGTDQFYVQMVVDTADATDGNYDMAGVYADNTPPQGDAPHSYKTKVFFENGSNPLTNVGNQLPKDYALSQNYPNPFNPSTTIKFALPKDGFVTMKVYDISGREVARLVSEQKKAGYHNVLFNASNLASGVYLYSIQSNDFVMTKRMVLIK